MKSKLNKDIGKRIQYIRKQRGLSQEQLAELLNIATTSLSFIETGRGFMSLQTLEKLSDILQVEPYEIFQFSSLKSNQEMYEILINKIDLIKNDNEKLKIAYTVLTNIL